VARTVVRSVRPGNRRQRESGVALLTVLILGTAVALMAHAGLMIGLAMDRAAASGAGAAEVDAGLRVRLHGAVSSLATLDDPLPAGVAGRRLSAELLRLRADSVGRGWAGLVWFPDPQTRLDALVAPVLVGRSLGLQSRQRVTRPAGDSCPAGWGVPDTLPTIAVLDWEDEHPLDIGPLDTTDWASHSAPPDGGTAKPVVMFSETSIQLGPGHWEGALLVDGALELVAGASVSGWVGVSGTLTIREGAEVRGVVRVGESLTVDGGGVLEAMPCSALVRLTQTDALSVPGLLGRSPWPTDPRY